MGTLKIYTQTIRKWLQIIGWKDVKLWRILEFLKLIKVFSGPELIETGQISNVYFNKTVLLKYTTKNCAV